MLKSKRLPHKFWLEGLMWANHVLNCAPTKVLKIIMPFEAWHGKNPSVDYFCVFGCVSYAHVPKEFCHKLDDKAVKCIFVGYSAESKGYRLYNPTTRKIFVSRDVIFSENSAHVNAEFNMPPTPHSLDVFEGLLPIAIDS